MNSVNTRFVKIIMDYLRIKFDVCIIHIDWPPPLKGETDGNIGVGWLARDLCCLVRYRLLEIKTQVGHQVNFVEHENVYRSIGINSRLVLSIIKTAHEGT